MSTTLQNISYDSGGVILSFQNGAERYFRCEFPRQAYKAITNAMSKAEARAAKDSKIDPVTGQPEDGYYDLLELPSFFARFEKPRYIPYQPVQPKKSLPSLLREAVEAGTQTK